VRPKLTAEFLNLHLGQLNERDLFCWLIASFLSGKRIQQAVAQSAYRVIVEVHHVDDVGKLAACSHRQLVSMLGQGRYARYDESTATRLTALSQKLIAQYGGRVSELVRSGLAANDLAKRLQEFDGIGPKTAEIFLRELDPVI
jgi:endonuclease III